MSIKMIIQKSLKNKIKSREQKQYRMVFLKYKISYQKYFITYIYKYRIIVNLLLQIFMEQNQTSSFQQDLFVSQYSQNNCNRTQISQQSIHKQTSPYLLQYHQYFDPVEQQCDQIIKKTLTNKELISKYKVSIKEEYTKKKTVRNYFIKCLIQIKSIEHNAAIINYFVYINKFRFEITMLNIEVQASQLNIIGIGGYGEICAIKLNQQQSVVCKRIKFDQQTNIIGKCLNQNANKQKQWKINPNKSEIQDALEQFTFYRLCSFFQIGPKIYDKFGFDLLCYQNLIQFYMEECKAVAHQKIEHDIKIALRILHKLKLIHKDVKPQNILFSPTYRKFVLIDFGISHQIDQNLGELTFSFKEGTLRFMCPQMQKIKNKPHQIDLYYNDAFGLMKATKQLKANNSKLLLKQLYRYDITQRSEIKNTSFYKGLLIIGSIINYNQEIFEGYFSNYSIYLNQQNLKCLCSHINFLQIKKTIEMNPFNDKSFIDPIEIFFTKKRNLFTLTQIEFLIRVYGVSKVLLSFVDEFQPFSQMNLFINILRNIQNDKQQNIQFKIWDKYSQIQLIKSLEKQSIYFYQKILSNETEKDINEFCQITLDLLLREKNMIKSNLKQLLFNMIYEEKTRQFPLHKLLLQICNTLNPHINLFNNYVDNHIYNLNTSLKKISYKKLVSFYGEMCDFEYLSKYELLLKQVQGQKKMMDINDDINDDVNDDVNDDININVDMIIHEIKNLYRIGMYYKAKSKILESFSCFYKSIQYCILIPTTIEFLEILTEIANNYKIILKFQKYQHYSLKAFQLHKKPEQYCDILLNIMWNIAQCCYLNGKSQQAKYYLEDSLKIALKYYQSEHCSIADYYSSLGCFCYNNFDFKQSLQYCKKSINILAKFKLQQKYTYVTALQIIGCIYNHQRKVKQGIDIFKKCLNIKINMYGDNHKQIAKTLNNLATQYLQAGQYENILLYAGKVIKICQNIKLNDHLVIRAYSLLGLAYFSLQDKKNMYYITKKSIEIVVRYFSQDSKYLAYGYSNLGKYYWLIKQYQTAISWYMKSIQIKEKQFGQYHFDILSDLNELSECYFQLKEYNICIQFLLKSMKIINMNHGKQYEKYFHLSLILADSYMKSHKYNKCLSILKPLLKIYSQQNSQNLYEIILRLGSCYFNLQEYEHVLYYYRKYIKLVNPQIISQDKNFCLLKCIECEIQLYNKRQDHYRKKKCLKIITSTNFSELQFFKQDLRILFNSLCYNKLHPDETIFMLLGLQNKQTNLLILQLYKILLDEVSNNFKGIWMIIQKLVNKKAIRIKNKEDLQVIAIYKRFLKWNRQNKLNYTIEKQIRKKINKILKN